MDPFERGWTGKSKTAGERRTAHRNVVQGGRQACRARHQLCRKKRLHGAYEHATSDHLHRPRDRGIGKQNHKGMTTGIMLFFYFYKTQCANRNNTNTPTLLIVCVYGTARTYAQPRSFGYLDTPHLELYLWKINFFFF